MLRCDDRRETEGTALAVAAPIDVASREVRAPRHDDAGPICGERLGYHDGARRFLAWLQRGGHTGETTRGELRRLYARHCDEEGLAWLPEARFFGAFADAIGRDRKHERRVPGAGPRRRTTTYDIPEVRAAVARRVA